MSEVTPSPDEIETAIYQTIDEFQFDRHVTPTSINSGKCEPFAEAVNEKLNGELTQLTTRDIIDVPDDEKAEPWHVWLTDNERHYDSEHPQGVDSWGKLSFFQRTTLKTPTLTDTNQS